MAMASTTSSSAASPARRASSSCSGRTARFVRVRAAQPWEADKSFEDWGALFFDANGDGLPDLYVASGGYQLAESSPLLQDRLYINRGGGRFVRDSAALPTMLTSTAAVRAGDFNGDGTPGPLRRRTALAAQYPYPARSYILRNDGGHFTDVTEQVAPELIASGRDDHRRRRGPTSTATSASTSSPSASGCRSASTTTMAAACAT